MTAESGAYAALTPGDLLAVLLRDRGLTQANVAGLLGRPPQAISEIVTGKKRVTATTARQFERAFGLSARVWLLLQAEADLALTTAASPDSAPGGAA